MRKNRVRIPICSCTRTCRFGPFSVSINFNIFGVFREMNVLEGMGEGFFYS